ncbi:MAG: VanZ family protein [Phycisphaerales bacterium]|nr:VanZ family protein [Phycisphaerales bacterium]
MSSKVATPALAAHAPNATATDDTAMANVRAARMLLPGVAAVAAVVLVTLGSLTPFRITGPAPIAWRLGDLAWHKLTVPDALTNFMVYVPIGALLFAWWRRVLGSAGAVLSATAVAAGMSLTLESTQAMIATRYASWYDLLLNAFGALIGAVFALLAVPTVAFLWRAIVHVAATPWWRKVMCVPVLLCIWAVLAAATAADGVRGLAAVARGTATLHGATTPLVDYFYQPIGPVTVWLGEIAIVFAALAWTCASICKRLTGRAAGLRASIVLLTVVAAVAGIVEVNGRWSVSDAIVAGLAMLTALAAYRDVSRQCIVEVHTQEVQRAAAERLERVRQQEANATARRRAFSSRPSTGLAG